MVEKRKGSINIHSVSFIHFAKKYVFILVNGGIILYNDTDKGRDRKSTS